MLCLRLASKHPPFANVPISKQEQYAATKTSECIPSCNRYARNESREEAEVKTLFKRLPKLLASLESFSEK